ncbi:MAG: alpha/beta hydrolase fold domain-containing protein [Niabella sp.]
MKEKSNITYCTVNGSALQLDVFYPRKKANGIAIVFVHGGGWRSGNRFQHHPLAQQLAFLGYTVFTPAYRLSTEALYPAAIYDIKSVIKWVRAHAKKYKIKPDKISIAGFSAGGELAAFVGNTNYITAFDGNDCNKKISSAVNAIIDLDGTLSFVHPESGEGDDSKRKSAATLWFGYSKKENPELWKAASPLTYAGENTVPTLFINSAVERMHAGRDDYLKILDTYKIYNEVHTFENSPHSFILFNPWFEPAINYMDEFLKKVFNKNG